jgi:hypothetical protein
MYVCKQLNKYFYFLILFIMGKGTVSWYFRLLFFHQSIPYLSQLINRLKPFHIWLCVHRDISFKRHQNRFQRGPGLRWKQKWSLEFPNFFFVESIGKRFGIRIVTYEIVLQDIPFSKKLRTRNKDLKCQRGHINFSGVNDPAEIDHELIKLFT